MSALIDTLKALPTDPGRVVDLYSQLFAASFIAIVEAGTEARLSSARFLTYQSPDSIQELPVFTCHEFVLPSFRTGTARIIVPGSALWPRLLADVKSGKCEAAVDPGQKHAIRLRHEIILGMVAQYAG